MDGENAPVTEMHLEVDDSKPITEAINVPNPALENALQNSIPSAAQEMHKSHRPSSKTLPMSEPSMDDSNPPSDPRVRVEKCLLSYPGNIFLINI